MYANSRGSLSTAGGKADHANANHGSSEPDRKPWLDLSSARGPQGLERARRACWRSLAPRVVTSSSPSTISSATRPPSATASCACKCAHSGDVAMPFATESRLCVTEFGSHVESGGRGRERDARIESMTACVRQPEAPASGWRNIRGSRQARAIWRRAPAVRLLSVVR
eukprot:991623-Pleurochrysis_carterae.AAC.2